MARDRANLRTDIWGDSEWRKLSHGAQWLYMYLLTSPSLSFVGVADWRPARIAPLCGDATADTIRGFAGQLASARFVFTDDETEEVLVRSFLRHDGLLLNPNLWKSVGNAFADVGSERLRCAVAVEARRLREANPIGFETSKGGYVNPWLSKGLSTLLDTPSGTPYHTPSAEVVDRGSPTATATATATEQDPLFIEDEPAKEVKIESPYTKQFLAWYEHYPRKQSKGDAFKAWEVLRGNKHLPALDDLVLATQQYSRRMASKEPEFLKLPGGWLRDRKWEDEDPSVVADSWDAYKLRGAR